MNQTRPMSSQMPPEAVQQTEGNPEAHPGGKKKRGAPPPGFGSAPSPEMQAIMPDFPKIRDTLYRLDVLFAIAVFLLQWLFLLVRYLLGELDGNEGVYPFIQIGITTAVSCFVLLVAYMFNKKMSDRNIAKFSIPVFVMGAMCLTLGQVYYTHSTVLVMLYIPLCMTAIFTDMPGIREIIYSLISIVLSVTRHALAVDTALERIRVVLEGLFVLGGMVIVYLVVYTVRRMTRAQRGKLISYLRTVKEAQTQAEAASEAKSAFLANMSHEIRTPINAILGMNEMILRESSDAQVTEYANSIGSAGTSLLSLVNDVLDFSKIESGRMELEEVSYDLASFIHDCYNVIAGRAVEKALEFKVEVSPELPVRLKGDEARVRQVVTNLLSNAVKYTERGSITLSVNGGTVEDRLLLKVTVKDTGIGIKKEDAKKLFGQFSRFDLEKNRSKEGSGLGLAITRQLLELMHGEIQVQSVYGEGSTFTVVIPQQILDRTPMGDFEKRYQDIGRKHSEQQTGFQAPEARILVVDDVEVNLKVIVNLLKKTKIQVDTATSGFRCLEMTAQQRYDMIFLDHMMPEMNGVETFRRLREMEDSPNRDTPVIMLTANAITGVREQYLEEGFADYLSKPVNSLRLEETILKFLPEKLVHAEM